MVDDFCICRLDDWMDGYCLLSAFHIQLFDGLFYSIQCEHRSQQCTLMIFDGRRDEGSADAETVESINNKTE